MKRDPIASFIVGVVAVLAMGLTTEQIFRDIYNPTKHALNVQGNFATPTPATPAYFTAVQADHPCHWFHMDAPSGTSETDVTTFSTCGESATNGTYTNSPTLNVAGIPGSGTDKAVTFASASTQYMSSISSPNSYFSPGSAECTTLNQGCSFELWIKPASSTEDCTPMWGHRVGVNNQWFTALNNTGSMRAVVYQSNCTTVSATTGAVGTYSGGTWEHMVVTTKGAGSNTWSELKFYGNASLLATVSAFVDQRCSDAGEAQFVAGRDGNNCNGTIDEVAYYNQQLNGTQITDHYNAGITAFNNEDWPFRTRFARLPHFRSADYFVRFVNDGYNTGQFASKTLVPRFFQPAYLPFEIVPGALK